jgi:hypothetical protein
MVMAMGIPMSSAISHVPKPSMFKSPISGSIRNNKTKKKQKKNKPFSKSIMTKNRPE